MKSPKAIIVFLTLTLTAFLLFSCGKSEMPEIRTSGVVREDILDYGPNLFFPYRILFQYNRLTNTVTRLCPDPECNGNCPLDAFVDFPHFIDENNLYFTAIDYNLHILHAYMNILTGEVKVLRDLSQAEDPFGSYILSSDGEYVWYQAKLLKEGGNKNNTKDYETWLCRMPKTGGTEERIFRSDSMCLRIATPYGIVMSDELSIGMLYFCASCSGEGTGASYLLRLDVQKKEVKKLVEAPVEEFALTGSGIYYLLTPDSPQIIKTSNDPDVYPSVLVEKQELRFCDLNGEHDEAVVTNSRTLLSGFTVSEGVLYGFIIQWNAEEQGWNKPFFGFQDLKTGKIAKAEGSTDHEIPQRKN